MIRGQILRARAFFAQNVTSRVRIRTKETWPGFTTTICCRAAPTIGLARSLPGEAVTGFRIDPISCSPGFVDIARSPAAGNGCFPRQAPQHIQ